MRILILTIALMITACGRPDDDRFAMTPPPPPLDHWDPPKTVQSDCPNGYVLVKYATLFGGSACYCHSDAGDNIECSSVNH